MGAALTLCPQRISQPARERPAMPELIPPLCFPDGGAAVDSHARVVKR